jgi:hypothetical protein
VRFTPPGGVEVLQAKIYSYIAQGSPSAVSLYIHNDLSGFPDTQRYETTYMPTHKEWDIIPITTTIYYDSDFWICIKLPMAQTSTEVCVTMDASPDHLSRIATHNPGDSWEVGLGVGGDPCIRAIVSGSGIEQELYPAEIVGLDQNFPNPVVNGTAISYMLSQRTGTELAIYDVTGKLVKSLVNDVEESGMHKVMWDRRDAKGERVHSGVYFYRLDTKTGGSFSRVMTVL